METGRPPNTCSRFDTCGVDRAEEERPNTDDLRNRDHSEWIEASHLAADSGFCRRYPMATL
jgi:hypothetical protein